MGTGAGNPPIGASATSGRGKPPLLFLLRRKRGPHLANRRRTGESFKTIDTQYISIRRSVPHAIASANVPAFVTRAETLSVVIPCHNEEAFIGPCLDALAAQTDDLHEIIVVDNNSTDRTAAP